MRLSRPEKILSFSAPMPAGSTTPLLPVFLPRLGCPGGCVYCATEVQTGCSAPTLEQLEQEVRALVSAAGRMRGNRVEIAFFGGTFTCLPEKWTVRLLAALDPLRHAGREVLVRCSTRPDACAPDRLAALKSQGLTSVELGVQSFDDQVLSRSGRGSTGQDARAACRTVRAAGLGLGIQLLPGLPGHTMGEWLADVAACIALRPDVVRIYPCVVVQGTPLARMWADGAFTPWPLERCVLRLSLAVARFWRENIPVIRIGLHPEPALLQALIAGPWHPSLGQWVRGLALNMNILRRIRRPGFALRSLRLPARLREQVVGYKRSGLRLLTAGGVSGEMLVFEEREDVEAVYD